MNGITPQFLERYPRIRGSLLPLGIIISGILIFWILIFTKPQANRIPKKEFAHLVEVTPVNGEELQAVIEATGLIRPRRETALQARVSGEIIRTSHKLVVGGMFKAGEVLLEIDPADFNLAIEVAESELKSAKANLEIEIANQEIAVAELELIQESLDKPNISRIKREPQAAIINAQVKAAEARLKRAKLDLSRTRITAPFDGTITELSIEQGGQIAAGTVVGQFVGTKQFWLEANIHEDLLPWVTFPDTIPFGDPEEKIKYSSGSLVKIYNPGAWGDTHIEANLSHFSRRIEDTSRTIRIFALIDQPIELLSDVNKSVFLNSFVRVEITGKALGQGFKIPRDQLRQNDTVWVFDKNNQLEIRKIEPVFRGKDFVYTKIGLVSGELLVSSQLSAPVPGMRLRHRDTGIGDTGIGDTGIGESTKVESSKTK